VKQFGRVDVVVNKAGYSLRSPAKQDEPVPQIGRP
jgi:hypothetical protein